MSYHDYYVPQHDTPEFRRKQVLKKPTTKFIIEGIDRLGKSTLTKNIQHKLGYHLVVHYSKPESLDIYERWERETPLQAYQENLYRNMCNLLKSDTEIIFDRGPLGELVYAPLYRGYEGDYVVNMLNKINTDNTKLILLTTSNFDLCVDDGESFNFDNKEKEQELFISAFNKLSSITKRVIIDVHDGNGNFKSPETILNEALYNTDEQR